MSNPKEIQINELPATVVIVRASCHCGNLLDYKGYDDNNGKGAPLNKYVCSKCESEYLSKDLFPRVEYDVKYSDTEGQRFDCTGVAFGEPAKKESSILEDIKFRGKPLSEFNYEILVNDPDQHFKEPLWMPIDLLSFKIPTDVPKYIQEGWVRVSGEKEPFNFEKIADADITQQKENLKSTPFIDSLNKKWWDDYNKDVQQWLSDTHDLMFKNKDRVGDINWRSLGESMAARYSKANETILELRKEIDDLNKWIVSQRQANKNCTKEVDRLKDLVEAEKYSREQEVGYANRQYEKQVRICTRKDQEVLDLRTELVDLKKRFLPGYPDEYRDVNGNCDQVAAAVDNLKGCSFIEFEIPRTLPHFFNMFRTPEQSKEYWDEVCWRKLKDDQNKLIKDLRQATGIGLMECKAILTDRNYDYAASLEYILSGQRKRDLKRTGMMFQDIPASPFFAHKIPSPLGASEKVIGFRVSAIIPPDPKDVKCEPSKTYLNLNQKQCAELMKIIYGVDINPRMLWCSANPGSLYAYLPNTFYDIAIYQDLTVKAMEKVGRPSVEVTGHTRGDIMAKFAEWGIEAIKKSRTIPHFTNDEIKEIASTITGCAHSYEPKCIYDASGLNICMRDITIWITHSLEIATNDGITGWKDLGTDKAVILQRLFGKWGIEPSTPTGFAARDKTVDDLTQDQLFSILEKINTWVPTQHRERISKVAEGQGIVVLLNDKRTLYISNKLVVSVLDDLMPKEKGWGVRVANMLNEWGFKPVK